MIVIADIGGTKTRVAASTDGIVFAEPIVFETITDDFDAGTAKLIEIARVVAQEATIDTFVAGIAGRFSADRATLLSAPHLPDWEDRDVAELLQSELNAPALLENDTALGALGEANAGAGVGAEVVAYIAVGTGIGGKKVVHGKLDAATLDAEIGHENITVDGVTKEFEAFVSGSAIAAQGIPDSPEHWDVLARAFAHGLAPLIATWSPDRIVLGGALVQEHKMSIANIEKHLRTITATFPEIVYAKLPYPGLTGALIYARQHA
jgi:predicted NBD/HSP70 family sugar kinase